MRVYHTFAAGCDRAGIAAAIVWQLGAAAWPAVSWLNGNFLCARGHLKIDNYEFFPYNVLYCATK